MITLRLYMLTGALLAPFIAIFVWMIYRRIKKNKDSEKMEYLFKEALDYSADTTKTKGAAIDVLIIDYWRKLLKPAGLVDPLSDDKRNAVKIIIINIAIYLVSFLITSNLFIGILPAILFDVALTIYCKSKISAIESMINEQVPSFLSALKSNVQSNDTPERALIGAIDNTAEPLYSELKIVKSLIETGTFATALSALRQRTKNEYLIFLCSCIELSNEVGANLEEQIVIIEKMIFDRQALTRKTDSAVAENMPILYVTGVAVPFLFVFMYFNNDQTREFWFHSLLSWILFFAVFVICGLGCWLGYRVIQNVRKMK